MFDGFQWPLIGATLLASVLLIAYSILRTGKNGTGGFVVCVLLSILAWIVKLAASMFVEVTTAQTPADWDQE